MCVLSSYCMMRTAWIYKHSLNAYTAHLDLSTICEELAKVKYKWWDIGLKLSRSLSQVEGI